MVIKFVNLTDHLVPTDPVFFYGGFSSIYIIFRHPTNKQSPQYLHIPRDLRDATVNKMLSRRTANIAGLKFDRVVVYIAKREPRVLIAAHCPFTLAETTYCTAESMIARTERIEGNCRDRRKKYDDSSEGGTHSD
jgi:hypothetical protein